MREQEGSQIVLGFNGQQWIQFPKRDFGDRFSIAVWIKASRSRNHAMLLANSWPRFDLGGFRLALGTGKSSTGKTQLRRVKFNTAAKGESPKTAQSLPGVIAFGRWTHVAVTVNRTEGEAKIYIDGKDVTEESAVRTDFPTSSENWYIGSARGHYDEFKYHGFLSDYRIYNRELSPAEIVRLAKLRAR